MTSLTHPPQIQKYRILEPQLGPSYVSRARNILRPYLPEALPLYRRLQFGRFFDTAYIFTNIDCWDAADLARPLGKSSSGHPFLMAFVDRGCRPETEALFFGSWEACGPPVDESGSEDWTAIDHMVGALLSEVKQLPVPESIHRDFSVPEAAPTANGTTDSDERDTVGFSRADYGGHAANPNIMLWGAVHRRTMLVLERLGVISRAYKSGTVPNFTFIFSIDRLPPARELPPGLQWGVLTPEHFPLVRSRTQIPRQDRTMAVLPSLAIYPCDTTHDKSVQSKTAPIAWAFVGLDAALTTLHVEPEWRGKGLAKALSSKLFREKMNQFWEPEVEQVAHGYVAVGNTASQMMCMSLGGKSDWECYWIRVDLSKIDE
ncbi:MAG: hypothetical protein FE78DRAFT_86086 [Acidomyces sp. 'richmondensis']|nr:MAG: hypothetical protein FE78DRAFT_86086 [Acidomyces sp. 'richmondensis']